MLALLVRRGEAMQRLGDISAARRLYGRAAEAGSARAATRMGETFDPFYLGQVGARGVAPEPDSAADWYRKAIAMGDPDAESRLRELGRGPVAAPPPSAPAAAGSERAVGASRTQARQGCVRGLPGHHGEGGARRGTDGGRTLLPA